VSLGKVALVRAGLGADHPVLDERFLRPQCRICGQGFASGQTWCEDKHDQGIGCTSCQRTMEIVPIGDIVIDVCLSCRAAWFDKGELGVMVRKHARRVRKGASSDSRPGGGSDPGAALDVLGMIDAGGVITDAAGGLIDVTAAAGEVAATAVEGVFGVLEGVLGIFDGL